MNKFIYFLFVTQIIFLGSFFAGAQQLEKKTGMLNIQNYASFSQRETGIMISKYKLTISQVKKITKVNDNFFLGLAAVLGTEKNTFNKEDKIMPLTKEREKQFQLILNTSQYLAYQKDMTFLEALAKRRTDALNNRALRQPVKVVAH